MSTLYKITAENKGESELIPMIWVLSNDKVLSSYTPCFMGFKKLIALNCLHLEYWHFFNSYFGVYCTNGIPM